MEHVDPWMGIIFPYANFFIFVAAAFFFFRKPLTGAARQKRADFEKLAAEAQAAKAAAEARLNELQRKQADLSKEIQDLMTVSKATSEAEAARIIADAKHLAHNLTEEAKKMAAAEVERARLELRQDIVSLVSKEVLGKIHRDVTSADHQRFNGQRISELQHLQPEA